MIPKNLRIKDTISYDDRFDLITKMKVVGIFINLLNPTDTIYKYAYPLCLEYYTSRSGEKRVSPIYYQFADIYDEYYKSHSGTKPSETDIYNYVNDKLGGTIIRERFIEKWSKVYEDLIAQYDTLSDYEQTKDKEGGYSHTATYDNSVKHTGNNSDNLTHDVTITDEGKVGTNYSTSKKAANTDNLTHDVTTTDDNKKSTDITVERSTDSTDDIYGFNSTAPVGDSTSTNATSETTKGNADTNTTHNVNTKEGTEKRAIGIDETTTVIGDAEQNTTHNVNNKAGSENRSIGIDEDMTKTGTDTRSNDYHDTETIKGRNASGAELLTKELNMRDRFNLFTIILSDIDSIATISIY